MRALYFDTFSGISGDMTVGALLAVGVPLDHLRAQLATLELDGYRLTAGPRMVNGIAATKFDVLLDPPAESAAGGSVANAPGHDPGHSHPHEHDRGHRHDHGDATHAAPRAAHGHRTFRDIRALLERSGVDAGAKDLALRIFGVLAEAEGRVHRVAAEEVTFHEVGAVDSIVDIVAVALGVAWLGVGASWVGPLPSGSGIIRSQHGPLPVPPPATAELLRGFDVRLGDGVGEMVTPTGAAIIAALAKPIAAPVSFRASVVGYGAGTRTLADRPNVLRLVLGEVEQGFEHDEMVLIETNIDDGNPELYEFVMERLFAEGARDVFLSPIQMKKNRPATLLGVLADPADRERLAAVILSETSSIGVRFSPVSRLKLPRRVVTVRTEFGEVRVKVSTPPAGADNLAPEYDDCVRLARAAGVPLRVVYQAALLAAAQR